MLHRFRADELNETAQSLFLRFLSYSSMVRSFTILSDTFLILYVLDLVGYAAAATLVAIRILVQAVFDYPTGILSDWFGQRLVLTLSFSFFGISYLLFSLATGYWQLMIAYGFFALGLAQQSGTLQTWFDNNYRAITQQEDPDREIYKIIVGKARTVVDLFGAAFLLLGGYLATNVSRNFVFQIQVIAMILLIIATWILIINLDEVQPVDNSLSYFQLLKEGVTSIAQSKILLLLVAASVTFQVGLGIWSSIIIFPIYFGYTGTDFGASIFRFTLFILGSVALWLVADRIGKMSSTKWLPRIHFIHAIFFYGGLALLFQFLPFKDNFNLSGIFVAGIIIFISHMLRVGIRIWLQQIYLDLIPDHRRNGFYSFVPTLVLLIQAPFLIGSGILIEDQGFVLVSLVLCIVTLFSTFLYYLAMTELDVSMELQ